MKLTIVMPAYNEETRISPTLEAYASFFEKKEIQAELDTEIFVVVNGTTDHTLDIVKLKQKNHPTINYVNLEQGGKGHALVEGFKHGIERKAELVGFVDSDMSTPAEAYYDLVRAMKGVDGAIASRWLKASVVKTKQTLLRRITSRTFNFIVRSLFSMPYRDTQCGAKLFRAESLKQVIPELGITRWAFDVDLIYRLRRKGCKIVEVPTTWEDNKNSKLNLFKVPIEMFSGVVRLRLINSPFNFVVRAYDAMPEVIKFHHTLL